MKKAFLVILLLGIQFSSVSCTADSEIVSDTIIKIPSEAIKFLDVSYGDNPQQIYDLYLPANRSVTKTKVIALVHGGRYIKGDKKYMRLFLRHFQDKNPNYAIVNINYVLADSVTHAFPNQILNLGAVIDKLTNEKDQLQILPEFALVGASSGAHLALMYDYVYDTNNRVKMVADIVGPTDFTDPFYTKSRKTQAFLDSLIDKNAYPAGTNYLEAISPALQVTSQASPTILFYGNADPSVPFSNAITLKTALNREGIENNLTVYDGGHANWEPNDMEDMLLQISAFMDTHLKIEE